MDIKPSGAHKAASEACVQKIDMALTDYKLSCEGVFKASLDHELRDGFITQVEYDERLRAYHAGLFGAIAVGAEVEIIPIEEKQ